MATQIKEVQLRRRDVKSYLPVPVINNAKKFISSHFIGRAPMRGLTPEQEVRYLTGVLDADPNTKEWHKAVADYWAEFKIPVPSEGVVLNITVDQQGNPFNLQDWISYQFALKHKLVAKNLEELKRNPTKLFYIHDPEEADVITNKRVQSRMKAYQELIRLIASKTDDANKKLRRVLRIISGINPDILNMEQVQNRLDEALNEDPIRFYSVVTDKDLDIRAEIDEMLEFSVLDRVGSHILFQGDVIGHTAEEAIQYFKNKSNTQTISILKAKLTEARNAKLAFAN